MISLSFPDISLITLLSLNSKTHYASVFETVFTFLAKVDASSGVGREDFFSLSESDSNLKFGSLKFDLSL